MEEDSSDCCSKKGDEHEKSTPPVVEDNVHAGPRESWIPEVGWATWVNSAKEKTKSAFELIKKDINEFSDTLQNETNSLVNSAAKKAQFFGQIVSPTSDDVKGEEIEKRAEESNETSTSTTPEGHKGKPQAEESLQINFLGLNWVKQMASEVVETVHKFATEDTTRDEANCTEEIHFGGHASSRKSTLDQCTLLQMQNDRRTFLQKPHRGAELYSRWLADFKISEYNGEINLLLGENSRLREIYAELVPSLVENHTFWHRYFFKVHLKEMEKQGDSQYEPMKLNVDKKGVSTADCLSPAPSNGARDDWSMCSSGRTTEAEELDTAALHDRRDASTPRPHNAEEDVDDWEECDEEADNEEKAKKKANE
ncbi:hypothetical protein GPALN_001907 [Globodera pallida]|nr:hypothetical protein GPALN_001907 [Globodera pallida]